MTTNEFIKLMQFPPEWIEWNMYPCELAKLQISQYRMGNEISSEHDRFGAFLWWISNMKTQDEAQKLIRLTYLDSDEGMTDDARCRINARMTELNIINKHKEMS